MIYTVTFNPSLDYHMVLSSPLSENVPNRVKSPCFVPGGKGLNVSFALSALGADNTALCFSGGDTGKMLENMLSSRGQKYECVSVPFPTRVNVKVSENEKMYELNASGDEVSEKHARALLSRLDELTAGDTVIFSGSTPTCALDLYREGISRAKKSGACVIADTSGEKLLDCAMLGAFLLKPNEHEIRELFGNGDVIRSAKKLCSLGAEHVLLSLGENGAVLLSDNVEYRCGIPFKMPVLNTVGAGDSMLAGFVYAYKNGYSLPDCLRSAVSAGSCKAYTAPEKPFDVKLFEKLFERSEVL